MSKKKKRVRNKKVFVKPINPHRFDKLRKRLGIEPQEDK